MIAARRLESCISSLYLCREGTRPQVDAFLDERVERLQLLEEHLPCQQGSKCANFTLQRDILNNPLVNTP